MNPGIPKDGKWKVRWEELKKNALENFVFKFFQRIEVQDATG